ncbi:MAG: DUF368 domain-containing protein [Clostridia bacterium]|nr:DUF368 domain-containing protein [Clostridia bacterium]
MNFFTSILKGFIIGIGAILPGISSGVLCVIFGIYDKLVNSSLGLFKDFKKNFLFLLPFIIGGIFGFLLFGKILNFFFVSYEAECKALFLGFIIGGIPSLIKTSNKKSNFKPYFLIFTFISFSIALLLIILEHNLNTSFFEVNSNYIYLIVVGFVMSAGIIVPGVSSTVILMCFGIYNTYLNSISCLNFYVLIPLGAGLALGSLLFLFLIKKMLENFPSQTFYTIIGFILGSTLILIPTNFNILVILLFLLGFSITFSIEKKSC